MNLIERTYIDELGIPKLVLIPDDESDLSTGIPLSVDLSSLFGHMPIAFQRSLYEALYAQNLVKKSDYFKPDSAQRFQAALRTVIKHDFLDVQSLLTGVKNV